MFILGVNIEKESVGDLRSFVASARERGIEIILVPLGGNIMSGRELDPGTWSTTVVGSVSSHLSQSSELVDELEWASHLGLTGVLGDVETLWPMEISRILQSQRRVVPWRLWARCKLHQWKEWHRLRTLCDYPLGLVVALEIDTQNPEQFKDVIRRWRSEPIIALILTSRAFILNDAGFPVLPRATQSLFQSLKNLLRDFRLLFVIEKEHDIVSEKDIFQTDTVSTKINRLENYYLQYLVHFGQNVIRQRESSSQERLEAPYLDVLQSPLQPLADHLDASTYDIFEQDPFKYQQYQLAITQFLRDQALSFVQILVIGAGRGPLVKASLAAADALQIKIRVTALEKNPHAIRALEQIWPQQTHSRVRIISGDARRMNDASIIEENGMLYDCVVSELLGSFGDNELSPECLLPISRWLRQGGVSIPCKYTSFAQPIASAKLWTDARRTAILGAPPGPPPALISPGAPPPAPGLETPFVVKLNNFTPLAPPLPCFTFIHPETSFPSSFDRRIRLCFPTNSQIDLVTHGLAGYFEATLYSDITISIHPDSHSPGMFSWFPLFFPFATPIYLNGDCGGEEKGQNSNNKFSSGHHLIVDLERCSDSTGSRIWYEWCVLEPTLLPIQNSNGRSSSMLL
mmetsp:Transcript_7612/g.11430  ORF Transcript_7612/g.11430 Transcript_7612/m.11430 type:complete len:631 (+) Transcript_7612:108-2000(+)